MLHEMLHRLTVALDMENTVICSIFQFTAYSINCELGTYPKLPKLNIAICFVSFQQDLPTILGYSGTLNKGGSGSASASFRLLR